MRGNLYDVSRSGFHGGIVNYVLVTNGAHDGNRAPAFLERAKVDQVRKRTSFQFKSWYDPGVRLDENGYPVIGQIFFGTDDRSIDHMTDKVVLDYFVKVLQSDLAAGKRIDIAYVGYADPSGAADYNQRLAATRAKAVQKYVERELARSRQPWPIAFYSSEVISMGENACTMNPDLPQAVNYGANRRVDIVWRAQSHRPPGTAIVGDYKGPLTNKLLFRSWGGGGLSLGAGIGVDFLELEIKNPYNGTHAWYHYGGFNAGIGLKKLPVSVARPTSKYEEKEIPYGFADIYSFGGSGGIQSAAAIAGVQTLRWDNATIRSPNGKHFIGLTLTFAGFDGQIGSSIPLKGEWTLLPYRTEAERTKMKEEGDRKRERERDKYPIRPKI